MGLFIFEKGDPDFEEDGMQLRAMEQEDEEVISDGEHISIDEDEGSDDEDGSFDNR